MLDDGGARIDPVAAVDIGKAVDLADRRPMDVAADDAIEPALARVMDGRLLEVEDEIERRLDLALGETRQRPVATKSQLCLLYTSRCV